MTLNIDFVHQVTLIGMEITMNAMGKFFRTELKKVLKCRKKTIRNLLKMQGVDSCSNAFYHKKL